MPRLALAAAVVVVACLAFVPAAGAAAPCTLVVTRDTVLDRDISCSAGAQLSAVEIGAPNVTLDLNGHNVSGKYGVRNQGFDGVTIKNGSAEGNDGNAVSIEGADRNVVLGVQTETSTRLGIALLDADRTLVAGSRPNGYRGSVTLDQGSDHNVIVGNQVDGYTGIDVINGSRNVIVANAIHAGEPTALALRAGTGNLAAFNVAVAGEDVIRVDASSVRAALIANRATRSLFDDGIDVDSPTTALLFNVANDNHDYGIEAVPGVFAFGNRAASNGQPAQCLNVQCR